MYQHNPTLNVWLNPKNESIAYSDGVAEETRLAKIIANAKDVSVNSAELALQCTDWVRAYHLSAVRCNLLRPFAHLFQGKTLEIGAGCGALTRYLAEVGGQVTALEGSLARAKIIASRTRDLHNVKVICDNFQHFQSDELFDTVTLIGVLEYSPLYITGVADPVSHVLTLAKRCLKPNGVLLVAIENQLGLKYFAGMPEDHVNTCFFGVQNNYHAKSPITFGRKVLEAHLTRVGFAAVECATPFPDYKMPDCVLMPRAIHNPHFNPMVLVGPAALRDKQMHSATLFSLPKTFDVLHQNGLLADMANSFMMVASVDGSAKCPDHLLAVHYSTNNRQSTFCKQTQFIQQDTAIHVERSCLYHKPALPFAIDQAFSFDIVPTEPYYNGKLLSEKLWSILSQPGWTIQQVGQFLREYVAALQQLNSEVDLSHVDSRLTGEFFDALPSNIIVEAPGHFRLIDQEWHAREFVTLGILLFRTLKSTLDAMRFIAKPQQLAHVNKKVLLIEAFKHAGFKVTQHTLSHYFITEMQFHDKVSIIKPPRCFSAWADAPLLMYPDRSHIHGNVSEAWQNLRWLIQQACLRRLKRVYRRFKR